MFTPDTLTRTNRVLHSLVERIGLEEPELRPSEDPLEPVFFFRARLRDAKRFAELVYQYLLILRVRSAGPVYDKWQLTLSAHARDGFALYDFPGPGRFHRTRGAYAELLRLAGGVRQLLLGQVKPMKSLSPPQEKPAPFSSSTEIDEPLRTLVPLLNRLGYRTLASCSGHDRPNPNGLETYAYVSFRSTEQRARDLLRRIKCAESAFHGKWVIVSDPEGGPGLYALQRFPECRTRPQARQACQDINTLTTLLVSRPSTALINE